MDTTILYYPYAWAFRNAAPVINLKSNVEFTTNGEEEPGTEDNPYTVTID